MRLQNLIWRKIVMVTPSAVATAPETLGPPLLSLEEVSEWTGTAKSTLYSMMSQRRGPRSLKIGRTLRFRPTDIQDWINELASAREAGR